MSSPQDTNVRRSGRTRHAARRGGRLPAPAEGTHRCMVLASGENDIPAVDLRSGSLTRLRARQADRPASVVPFSVVDVTWAEVPERDDLAQPEAVSVADVPEPVGTLHGRRARRVLRHLVAPVQKHLLGFPGSSAPYWEFRGMQPSVAVVVPTRGPLLFRHREDGSTWARFSWPRSDNWLPVTDPQAASALRSARRDRLFGRDLANALGFRPRYLVVTLSPPLDGHCYKTVAALLPRP
jgi:hypothetical protein